MRVGDTLLVIRLDRFAQIVPDAREISDQLQAKGVTLAQKASVYDPVEPMDKRFVKIVTTFAEFEVNLIKLRTR